MKTSLTQLVRCGNVISLSVWKEFTPAGWTEFYSLHMHTMLGIKCPFLGHTEAHAQHWAEVAPLYFEIYLFLFLKISQHINLKIFH